MKGTKRKKTFLYWGICIVLPFFALVSILSMQKAFFIYTVAKERRDNANFRKQYVEKQLKDLQALTAKRRYDYERTGLTKGDKLKKIELRGVDLSPEKNRPFSKNEMRFNVIEQ